MSTVTISQTFMPIDDADAALGFYRDTLGFEVQNDVDMEGMRWITLGSAAQPEVKLVLESVGAGAPGDKETLADLLAKGVLGRIIFGTDDCDATFEKLRAAGAEVLQEPMDQFWGVRDCAFRDPAGSVVRFQQAPAA
ncbi:MAG TPA: VOC family protein [Solirubrobacteraceae bacterium]|nr:VOC family protein [Solirubrobacteraceae bacterium]